MSNQEPLKGHERIRLIEELERKYSKAQSFGGRWLFLRKKYAWIIVIKAAKFLKRFLDIVISLFLLVFLSPLILLIVILIKLHDGGPILYVTNRVGKWGKEFRFPKFRTMRLGAKKEKEELLKYRMHQEDEVMFKMAKDPRITWIGKILRRLSLDELPQLWTVLIGDMSLVGPRPPLPEEVAKYTVAQRQRLDIKPGITGIWQVSGRSDIPFPKQVQLDKQYIESQSLWLDLILLLKTIPAVIFGRGAY